MHILSRHLLVLPIQLLFIPSIRTTSILFVFCSLGDVGCTTGFWKAPHMISDSGTINYLEHSSREICRKWYPSHLHTLEGVELVEPKSALGHFCLDMSVILFEVILIPRLFQLSEKCPQSFSTGDTFSPQGIFSPWNQES